MRIVVRVYPNARVTRVGGRYGDSHPAILVVRVAAPAAHGKANAATVQALARALGLPRKNVEIVAGGSSRTKVIEIQGADPRSFAALLEQPTQPEDP